MLFKYLIEKLERDNNNAEHLKLWLSLMPKYSLSVYDNIYGFVQGLSAVGYIKEITAIQLLQELKIISRYGVPFDL